MPRKPSKSSIAAKIAASATRARAALKDAPDHLDRLRKRDLQFLKDFPPEYFDLPCIEPRCKLCKHVAPDQDLRRYLNHALLSGANHSEILEHLAANGIDAGAGNLSNHYRKHVLPYVMDTIRQHATTSIFVRAAKDLGVRGSLAEIMVSSILLKLQPIVDSLDPKELALLEPARQIMLLLKATQALANIQSLEAGARLRAIELTLKQSRLTETERKAMARATAELRTILKAHPELWAQLEPILQPLVGDAERTSSYAALPEATDV